MERKGDFESLSGQPEERPKNQTGQRLSAEPSRADDMQTRIEAPAKRLAAAEAEVAAKDSRLAQLESRLRTAEETVRSQRSELEMIRHSASWRLVERLWRWQKSPSGKLV